MFSNIIFLNMNHAQIVMLKLDAIREEFEWEDGTFHYFKERKRLPKDRRDVHGNNLISAKRARKVMYIKILYILYAVYKNIIYIICSCVTFH